MCKWNAFTIDRKWGRLQGWGSPLGKIFSTRPEIRMENHEHPSLDTLGP